MTTFFFRKITVIIASEAFLKKIPLSSVTLKNQGSKGFDRLPSHLAGEHLNRSPTKSQETDSMSKLTPIHTSVILKIC